MRFHTVVIGGGQAGLAMGWQLARQGRDFVILDAAERVGDVWRSRWDSVRRAPYGQGFLIESSLACYQAEQVVVATGPFHRPALPPVAAELGSDVVQLHSGAYRNPSQLPDGPVVVVGAGNSGVQIAAELATTRPTSLAAGEALPSLPLTFGGMTIFRWLDGLGAMDVAVDSWMGAKASRREFLIGSSTREVARSGVRVTGRVIGASAGRLRMANGESIEPAAVVWATGYRPDYRFLDLPVVGARGEALHQRGVTTERGLFFPGTPWQHTRGSALLGWVGRDAEYIAARLASSQPRAA